MKGFHLREMKAFVLVGAVVMLLCCDMRPNQGYRHSSRVAPLGCEAGEAVKKEKTYGKRNPRTRQREQQEELRKLERLRQRSLEEHKELSAPKSGGRKSRRGSDKKRDLHLKKIIAFQEKEAQFWVSFDKKHRIQRMQIDWESLEIPVIVKRKGRREEKRKKRRGDKRKKKREKNREKKRTGRRWRVNFTSPFTDGVFGIAALALKKLYNDNVPEGTWDLNWVDARGREQSFMNDEDLSRAVLTHIGKNPKRRFAKPVRMRLHFFEKKSNTTEGIIKGMLKGMEGKKNKTSIDKATRVRLVQELRAKKKAQIAKEKKQKRQDELAKAQQGKLKAKAQKKAANQKLQEMAKVFPPAPKDYPGIVWSPLLRQFETSFIHGGKRKDLGLFDSRQLAWSAVCMEAQKASVSLKDLFNAEKTYATSTANRPQSKHVRREGVKQKKETVKGSAGIGMSGRDG